MRKWPLESKTGVFWAWLCLPERSVLSRGQKGPLWRYSDLRERERQREGNQMEIDREGKALCPMDLGRTLLTVWKFSTEQKCRTTLVC